MRVRSVLSAAALVCGLPLLWQPAHASVPPAERGSVVAAGTAGTVSTVGMVEYECTTSGVTGKQTTSINVELTIPTDATTGRQFTIGWSGTYTGTALTAPTAGLPADTKLYAYVSISGLSGLTSATGVGTLDATGAGQSILLPTTPVSLATTSNSPGTATVKPGAINFGTAPGQTSIECEPKNRDTLTTYPLTITAGGQGADPDPTDTTTQPSDETTSDDDAETGETPQDTDGEISETPAGGAETGGGGESGPDGRALVLTGSLVTFGAVSGLLWRRRGTRETVGPRA
ncbi:hypothetical protein ABT352_13130 [Streptosporangium sp. NPDC000563]|uniref:hypothetical protein n=1 Tax=Streptosporangium sp. NPDC000563 TaxID=3154366 RepID=UPI0033174BEB